MSEIDGAGGEVPLDPGGPGTVACGRRGPLPAVPSGPGGTLTRHFVIASDFDQTLSFNDSGEVLSHRLGLSGFAERARGLARTNLVQQAGDLAYLLRHDPDYRSVRREDLRAAGRDVRLKPNIDLLVRLLTDGIPDHRFSFFVISDRKSTRLHSSHPGL